MFAGSEALKGALLYYVQIKEAHHKGIPTAKLIYEYLSGGFKRGTYKKKTQ